MRADDPIAAFARHVERHPDTRGWLVAFSGGMDSRVLLHVAAERLGRGPRPRLRAIHVDHGLHPDSAGWARAARAAAESEGVALVTRTVRVERRGQGMEAAAREARYAAFAEALGPGEQLLLAHHADDLAETFLLAALRGSGVDGLAAMPPARPFAAGVLGRPFLDCRRAALTSLACAAGLRWSEDPSNRDLASDRNFLRHEILPRLAERWPAATATLGRAAGHAAAASATLAALAEEDLARARGRSATVLDVATLAALPRERAGNAIRRWLREAGLPAPRLADLERVLGTLVHGSGAGAIAVGGDGTLRRYRGELHLLLGRDRPRAFRHRWAAPYAPLALPEAAVVLSREGCAEQGIALPANGVLEVRSRRGGETIRLGDPPFGKSLKKLLQEAGVPPWRRQAIPLLFADGRLVAVWGIAVASEARADRAAVGGGAQPARTLAVDAPVPLDLGQPEAVAARIGGGADGENSAGGRDAGRTLEVEGVALAELDGTGDGSARSERPAPPRGRGGRL